MKVPPISSPSFKNSNESQAIAALKNLVADFQNLQKNPNNPGTLNQDWAALQNSMGSLSPSLQQAIKNFLAYQINYDPTQPLNIDDGLATASAILALATKNPQTNIGMGDFQNLVYLQQIQTYLKDFISRGAEGEWDSFGRDLGDYAEEFDPSQLNSSAQAIYNKFGDEICDWADSTVPPSDADLENVISGAAAAFQAQLSSF